MKILCWALLILSCLQSGSTVGAADDLLNCRHWPINYFNNFDKLSIRERDKLLNEIDLKLQAVNKSGEGMIVKGAIAEKITPDKQFYSKMTVCDESGLIVRVNNVPNIFYNYNGPKAKINNNTFMVIKNVKVNSIDSYLLNAFVIEGDYHAFVQKYIEALLKEGTSTNIEAQGPLQPIK